MSECPHCRSASGQIRFGRQSSGSQRYRCSLCRRVFTPEQSRNGYPEELRVRAVTLYLRGHNLRSVGRALNVSHQSVANWAKAYFPHEGSIGTAALLFDAEEPLSLDELSPLLATVMERRGLSTTRKAHALPRRVMAGAGFNAMR